MIFFMENEMRVMKSEWHQVESQYVIDLDENLLAEIYPECDDEEIQEKIEALEKGELDIEDVMNDAWVQGVELDWDHEYDDWWTSRKGGYEVTYKIDE